MSDDEKSEDAPVTTPDADGPPGAPDDGPDAAPGGSQATQPIRAVPGDPRSRPAGPGAADGPAAAAEPAGVSEPEARADGEAAEAPAVTAEAAAEASGGEPDDAEAAEVPAVAADEAAAAEAAAEDGAHEGADDKGTADEADDQADDDEAAAAEVVPVEVVQAEAVPVEAVSVEVVAAGAVPVEAVVAEPVPADPAPAKAVPGEAVTAKTVPAEAVAVVAVPAEVAPAEAAPVEAVEAVAAEPVAAEPEPVPVEPDPEPGPAPEAAPTAAAGPDPADAARRRLVRALLPHAGRSQLLAALVAALLGFGVVVTSRQANVADLASLRESDLISVLDNVSQESARLDAQARSLQETLDQLRTSSDRAPAARQAAAERLAVLGVLAGTTPATGPGIELRITDTKLAVTATELVETVQELRDAGAEAMQLGPVRIVASTALVDDPNGILVDGTVVSPPYRLLAIGDPQTLGAALEIPGGVLEVLRGKGAEGVVRARDTLTVTALRSPRAPQYARPAQGTP